MRMHRTIQAAVVLGGLAFASAAMAEGFSTSALSPGKLPATGVVTGSFPNGEEETSYYFATDLKAGSLATQISIMGSPDKDKQLELELLDAKGKSVTSYWIMNGLDANEEAARVFKIDSSGKYTVRLNMKGPETTSFKVALAGASIGIKPAADDSGAPYSTSFLAPSPLPANGTIEGVFPGGDKVTTHYYFAANLKAGELLSQINFSGSEDADKQMELNLLKSDGRSAGSYYIMSRIDANQDATKSIKVDATGPYVLRISVKGAEGTSFKADVGGSAVVLSQ